MVEGILKSVLEILNDGGSVKDILEDLQKTNTVEFAKIVFTKAANCMKTKHDTIESILNLVSFAVTLFNVTCFDTIRNILKLIGKIFLFITGRMTSFSMISENLYSELSEKMKCIEEKLHAFCSCFDARIGELITFNKQEEKRKKRIEKLLDDVNYKEIGMGFSGELEAIIKRYKDVREEGILKSVGECLHVYVRVAIMRYMMQILILSIIPAKKMKSATKQIQNYMERDILRRIAFLTGILEPSRENAIFLSSFSITDYPQLDMFLKTKWSTTNEKPRGLEMSAFVTNKSIALHPVVFRGHWMNAAAITLVWSTSTVPHGDYAQFVFEAVSEKENNLFFIKSFQKQSYIYMKTNSYLSQTSTRPREKGMFKVLRLQNNNCLISVVKYPGRFIYMPNTLLGWIKGAVTDCTYDGGLPTETHEWSLKEVCHHRNGETINPVENPKIVCAFSKG